VQRGITICDFLGQPKRPEPRGLLGLGDTCLVGFHDHRAGWHFCCLAAGGTAHLPPLRKPVGGLATGARSTISVTLALAIFTDFGRFGFFASRFDRFCPLAIADSVLVRAMPLTFREYGQVYAASCSRRNKFNNNISCEMGRYLLFFNPHEEYHLINENIIQMRRLKCSVLLTLRQIRIAAASPAASARGGTSPPGFRPGLMARPKFRRHRQSQEGHRQRDAVILIGLDGWSYERVARAASLPVGTVRPRLSCGRDRLKMAA
jgi:hypothetical protein